MPSAAARFLTIESAACALSFITSPSWPVRISLPEPGMRVASMNRMSPPTGVQASPVATPGTLVRIATSLSNFGAPRIGDEIVARDADRPAVCPSAMRTAAWRSAWPICRSRLRTPGFAGVVLDDVAQRVVVDLDLARLEPVRLDLAAHQIAVRDLELLVGGVAGEADDLHAVAQRPRNGVEHVRGGDEHHAATDRTARRDNCRGTCCSAPGRALRAAPRPDRRGCRRRACRSRRASSRNCARRPCGSPG